MLDPWVAVFALALWPTAASVITTSATLSAALVVASAAFPSAMVGSFSTLFCALPSFTTLSTSFTMWRTLLPLCTFWPRATRFTLALFALATLARFTLCLIRGGPVSLLAWGGWGTLTFFLLVA
jgi:hypothetical protein